MSESAFVPLWVCEDCGGPANWTFIDGDPYYHCQRGCAGFAQLPLDLGDPGAELDRVVSVSAVERERGRLRDQEITDQLLSATGLPF